MNKMYRHLLGDERLVAELHRLDVTVLAQHVTISPQPMAPHQLLAALARHEDARLQGSLILLFLRRPEFSAHIGQALESLDTGTATSLKLFFQAAVYLQREMQPILEQLVPGFFLLPDLFSRDMVLPPAVTVLAAPGAAQPALDAVGEIHRRTSGWDCNWASSYRQHLPLFIRLIRAQRHEFAHA